MTKFLHSVAREAARKGSDHNGGNKPTNPSKRRLSASLFTQIRPVAYVY